MQAAAKVGFLVVVFVALLYGAYAILGKAFARPNTNTYYAEFADVAGTNTGTGISMAGVRIGTVKKVELESPTSAKLTLEIDQTVKIPNGSVVKIGGDLIGLGTSSLQIIAPKTPIDGYVPNGGTIPGVKSSAIDSILPPEGRQMLTELNLTLKSMRTLLQNQSLEKKLEKLIDNSSGTLAKFGTLADQAQGLLARTNRMVGQNQPELVRATHSAALAMGDIRKSTQLLTQLVESGKYQDQTLSLLKQLNATAAKATDLMTNLNGLVNDPKMQADMKQTMSNVDKMTDTGTRIATNTEEMTKNGVTLTKKANDLADKANEIADEAKTALQKISGFFNKGGTQTNLTKVEAHLDLLRQSEPAHWRSDLYARFDIGKSFVDVGLYDAFESNKVILEVGEPLGRLGTYRYGIYASKPAVGVDFRVAPRVTLRSDLFDINKPRFNLRTQFDFGNGFVGWLGFERIFDRDAFVAGVGIRK